MNKKPILYSFRRCPYAMRARIFIKLCKIEVQLREVVLRDIPQEMLEISPKAIPPVCKIMDIGKYKYDLQKVSKSNEMLNKILKIIDVDTSFIPLTYYNLYINFK